MGKDPAIGPGVVENQQSHLILINSYAKDPKDTADYELAAILMLLFVHSLPDMHNYSKSQGMGDPELEAI